MDLGGWIMAELKRTSLIERYKQGTTKIYFDNVEYNGTDKPWDDLSTELQVSIFMTIHRGEYQGSIHGLLAENVLADEDLKFDKEFEKFFSRGSSRFVVI